MIFVKNKIEKIKNERATATQQQGLLSANTSTTTTTTR